MNPFRIPGHTSNTPLVLVLLSVAGVLGGCGHESKIPSQPPRAVRLATVSAPQTSGETLRYSASILPFAQVDLMFRSSGYVTSVRQVRGADGRTRDIGTGDYAEKSLTLAHIRREDLQNQVAQAQAQLDQAVAQHAKADQDFQRAKALYSTQSLTKPDYDQSQAALDATRQELAIQTENDATPLKGRVTSISPAADIKNRIFAVEVTVGNRNRHLKPGMIASVSLGEAPRSSISIPLSAIVPFPSEPDHFAVMVAHERAGTLVSNLRKIQMGTTHDSSVAVRESNPESELSRSALNF